MSLSFFVPDLGPEHDCLKDLLQNHRDAHLFKKEINNVSMAVDCFSILFVFCGLYVPVKQVGHYAQNNVYSNMLVTNTLQHFKSVG